MKNLCYILLLISNITFAQKNEKFLSTFLFDNELEVNNSLTSYNKFDFTKIWLKTQNVNVVGIIDSNHQRIKIKIISIIKDLKNPNLYIKKGKSLVKENICNFNGTIVLKEIRKYKNLNFGVDNEFENNGIKTQGILVATYEFEENKLQKNSGVFKGQLYSKWYLSKTNQIEYDDIQSISDEYMNNAFIGFWKSYSTNAVKICNWGDYRVPNANQDFDIGAGEFSPNDIYLQYGWQTYRDAYLDNNKQARQIEEKHWWK